MSESALRVRVDPKLRREFIDACRASDLTASQVLRAYMRDYLKKHERARPGRPPSPETPP